MCGTVRARDGTSLYLCSGGLRCYWWLNLALVLLAFGTKVLSEQIQATGGLPAGSTMKPLGCRDVCPRI